MAGQAIDPIMGSRPKYGRTVAQRSQQLLRTRSRRGTTGRQITNPATGRLLTTGRGSAAEKTSGPPLTASRRARRLPSLRTAGPQTRSPLTNLLLTIGQTSAADRISGPASTLSRQPRRLLSLRATDPRMRSLLTSRLLTIGQTSVGERTSGPW